MKDTTRLIIVFVLVMVVLYVWQLLTPQKPLRQPPIVQNQSETTKTESAPLAKQQVEASTRNMYEKQKLPSKETPATESEAILENERFRIVFSSLGATIKSVYLKKYRAELIPAGNFILPTKPTSESLPDIDNWKILYHNESTVVFQNVLTKTYQLKRDYSLVMKIENPLTSNYQICYESGLALTEANKKDEMQHFSVFYQSVSAGASKINKQSASKIKQTALNGVQWVALKSKYFATILSAPSYPASVNLIQLNDGRIGYIYTPAKDSVNTYMLYFGPLHYEILRGYNLGWEALVDLGWTRIFSIAILKVLMFLYSIFKNYGVAIIIFSVIIKAIFFPLTRMSNKQMLEMQKIQPKLEELKKKYKNDPQTLNRETMQLYRLYKINPFSGCLPLIFQLPIFWAMYSVLQKTIELRRANFVFWLKDLSLKDPYYILPILMGVSFLIQNFLTSADKRNMALLIFMPIFFTVIFLNFPSGLQLYWFVFNLLSIVESIISRGGIKWKTQKILTPTSKP